MQDLKGRFAAVLPAGGLGKRMGGNIPKQLMVLGGKPVYRYSLETFLKMDEIAEVVMAVPADWKDHFEKEIFDSERSGKFADLIARKMKIVVGGAERWQSVENGVNALTSDAEYVLVHDVARPFVSEEIIREANAQAVSIKAKAERDIEQERRKAVNEIKDEIGDMAMEIAGKVIGREINSSDHEKLIDDFINKVGEES